MTQQHEIRWADTLPPFAGPGSELPTAGYAIEAMADGTNFGGPEAIIEIVRSLLTDGSLAVLEGWDNRTVPIRLRLSAPTAIAGPALAEAESALMGAILATPKAPLIYVPPAQDAATCVFDVVAAKLDRDTSDGWDRDEVMREERYYLLTLTCLPFARTENTVVVPALGVPIPPDEATVVDIDTCDSTAGWSYTSSGLMGASQSASAGAIRLTGNVGAGKLWNTTQTRTGSVTMGATPYLRISLSTTRATIASVTVTATGLGDQTLPVLAIASSAIAGASDYYVQPTGGWATFASMRVAANDGGSGVSGTSVAVNIHHVARTDALPTIGTTRQQSRTAEVTGSAPTQAAIRLFDETPAALGGDVLVYSSRSSWNPSLRPYRASSSTVTTDGDRVSGARNTLAADMVFEFAAADLADGTHALMALVDVDVAGDLSWSARVVDAAGATTLGSEIVVSGSVAVGATTGYEVVTLGAVALPVVPVEGDQKIELTLSGTADMSVDEAWLFNLDDGVLTWVRNDDVAWVEIRSPELDATRPSVFGGTGAVDEDGVCIDWACQSFGAHRFDPGLMQIFTVCSSSLVSQSEIEFYPRGHSHVEAGWTE